MPGAGIRLNSLNSLGSLGINPQIFSLYEKQRSYMFNVHINLPFFNSQINALMPFMGNWLDIFTFSVVSTTLPGKKREFDTKRFMNETYTQPKGSDWTHEWKCQLRASEVGFEMDIIRYWFGFVEIVDNLDDAKGSIELDLIKLDGQTVNRLFILNGMYPLVHSDMENLNHDDKTGLAFIDCEFAFDQVKYGPLDLVMDAMNNLI